MNLQEIKALIKEHEALEEQLSRIEREIVGRVSAPPPTPDPEPAPEPNEDMLVGHDQIAEHLGLKTSTVAHALGYYQREVKELPTTHPRGAYYPLVTIPKRDARRLYNKAKKARAKARKTSEGAKGPPGKLVGYISIGKHLNLSPSTISGSFNAYEKEFGRLPRIKHPTSRNPLVIIDEDDAALIHETGREVLRKGYHSPQGIPQPEPEPETPPEQNDPMFTLQHRAKLRATDAAKRVQKYGDTLPAIRKAIETPAKTTYLGPYADSERVANALRYAWKASENGLNAGNLKLKTDGRRVQATWTP